MTGLRCRLGRGYQRQIMEYLLVDAYNVINAWKDVFDLGILTLEECRDKLLNIMSNYQGYNGDGLNIVVVFDAHMVKGRRRAGRSPGSAGRPDNSGIPGLAGITGLMDLRNKIETFDNITVIYTKEKETADNFIERFVYLFGETNTVKVVTSDYLEQTTILRKGGVRMLPRELKEAVRAASREGEVARESRGVIAEDGTAGLAITATGWMAAMNGKQKTSRITAINSRLSERVAAKLEAIRRSKSIQPDEVDD